jgi:hypothetical protein
MRVSTIRPGLLVSLKTSVRGGVTYTRRDLATETAAGAVETEAAAAARAVVSTWETTRTIVDAEEHRRAIETRGRVRSVISRECIGSSFGLLCPQARETELQGAITEAQRIAAEFNATARHCRIDVYTLTGRVASDDVQAARAIGAEVRELVASMQAGIMAADPGAIREAANKARELAGMLAPEVAGNVSEAIEAARKAAREIVRRVEKDGERAADVVQSLRLDAFDGSRFAALDLDDGPAAAPAPVMPAESRAVDLDTAEEIDAAPMAAAGAFMLDLDDGAPLEIVGAAVGMVPALEFAGA